MVLRLPTSIADATLLEDEPFRCLFEACYASSNTRRATRRVGANPNSETDGVVADVVKEMRATEHGVDAATLWVHHALHVPRTLSPSHGRSPITIPMEAPTERELAIFVEFFQLLHDSLSGSLEHAMKQKTKGSRKSFKRDADDNGGDGGINHGEAKPTDADGRLVAAAEAFLNRECKQLGIDYRPDLWRPLEECNVVPGEEDAMAVNEEENEGENDSDRVDAVASSEKQDEQSKKKSKRKSQKRLKSEAPPPIEEEDADVEDNTRLADEAPPALGVNIAVTRNLKKYGKKHRGRKPTPVSSSKDAEGPVSESARAGRKRAHSTALSSPSLSSLSDSDKTDDAKIIASVPDAGSLSNVATGSVAMNGMDSDSSLTDISDADMDELNTNNPVRVPPSQGAAEWGPAGHASLLESAAPKPTVPAEATPRMSLTEHQSPDPQSTSAETTQPTPSISVRRGAPRKAANREGLKTLAVAETRYHELVRRGEVDLGVGVVEEDHPVVTNVETKKTSGRRGRKRVVTEDSTVASTAQRAPTTEPETVQAPETANDLVKPPVGGKAAPAKRKRKATKRRKGAATSEEQDLRPQEHLQATPPQERLQATLPQEQLQAVPPQEASETAIPIPDAENSLISVQEQESQTAVQQSPELESSRAAALQAEAASGARTLAPEITPTPLPDTRATTAERVLRSQRDNHDLIPDPATQAAKRRKSTDGSSQPVEPGDEKPARRTTKKLLLSGRRTVKKPLMTTRGTTKKPQLTSQRPAKKPSLARELASLTQMSAQVAKRSSRASSADTNFSIGNAAAASSTHSLDIIVDEIARNEDEPQAHDRTPEPPALLQETSSPSKQGRRSTKRSLAQCDEESRQSPLQPSERKERRKTSPLPNRVTFWTRRACTTPPDPAKPTIRIPPTRCLALGLDMGAADTVLRDAAQESLEVLTSGAEPAGEWEVRNPDEEQGVDADSSDEEPICAKVATAKFAQLDASKRHTKVQAHLETFPSISAPGRPRVKVIATEPEVVVPKLPLTKYPPIWAESRQEVCESFDWFRSYQGGVYFLKGHVKGYLLGGFSASRDLFHNDGKLIISHGGGKAESIHSSKGTLESVEASDQMEDDKSVRALLQTYRTKRPLALLIDDKYKLFPLDLSSKGCTYAVLGWYTIARVWAEYQDASNSTGRVVRYKFAFQWCRGQGQPWWQEMLAEHGVQGTADEVPGPSTDVEQTCQHCNKPAPQVYEQGWVCLTPKCRAFWQWNQHASGDEMQLTYSQDFLKPVSYPGEDDGVESLVPSPPDTGFVVDGATTTQHFAKGWHCKICGRLSSRFKWEHWECRSCGAQHGHYGRLRVAREFFGPVVNDFRGRDIMAPRLGVFDSLGSFGNSTTYILPDNRGKIHVLRLPPCTRAKANDIFQAYQKQASDGSLKFRRFPMRAHKCRGTLLTNYFSQNSGAPYQYIAGTDSTVPMDKAPSAVIQALDYIHSRISEAGIDLGKPFNEVLSAAYLEEQKMSFHSDSEKGLGPVVASLSLGASAIMHFRLHAKYAADMPNDASREVLKLFLRHGDVLIMEGEGVQTYYEHTVIPLNFRIAATARYIGAENASVVRR